MTRFIVEYISEPDVSGNTSKETTYVSASDVAAATELVLDKCGSFINILSVVPSSDVAASGGDTTSNTAGTVPVAEKTAPGLIKTIKAELAMVEKQKPAKVPKQTAEKKSKPTVEKKVTASSQVRSRIDLAKQAGQSLEQACDEIVLWCMTNLGMSKSTARGYTTSQWIRVN